MTVLLYDAAALIESVVNRAHCPKTRSSGTDDADILRCLNEELRTRLFPKLLKAREEYNVYSERIALVASTTRYRISKRAGGNRYRKIFYVNSSGERRRIHRASPELIDRYRSSDSSPQAFYLEGNHIVLVPDMNASASGELEVSYYWRPSDIVLVAETRIISAVNVLTGAVTCSSALPGGWTDALYYDIHGPDSGAEIRVFNIKPSAIATPIITFAPADINGSKFGKYVPLVGDYVCLAGECAIPALPAELHPLLALAAAKVLMQSQGDLEGAGAADTELKERLSEILATLFVDRTEGEPESLCNPHSFLGPGGSSTEWQNETL